MTTTRLTALDLDTIGQAREMADADGFGDLAAALGRAQHLLGKLIAIIERD